jgi:hypothetical protein
MNESYWEKEDGCVETATDNPSVYIAVTRNGAKKMVSYNYGCRGLPVGDRIDWISEAIDRVAGIEKWIGQ